MSGAGRARLREARATAIVRVDGYTVTSPMFEDDELDEAAAAIASAIGAALSSLGLSCEHGTVRVDVDGREGRA